MTGASMRYHLTARLALAASLTALLPIPAFAHVGPGAHGGFVMGLAHPLSGADHVLAMVAVGVLAASLGGRAVLALPAAFVGAMLLGAGLGAGGVALPLVEPAIALSVIVLAGAVAAGLRLPTALAIAVVGLFAVFHGHAHGSEGAQGAAFLPYAAGFGAATVLLHLGGIGLGRFFDRLGPARSLHARRLVGSLGALAGVVLISG
jgi:urease accessory protein